MERSIQVTSGQTYKFKFSGFAVTVGGETKTVPLTLEELELLENDPGVESLVRSGEIILHKPKEVKTHDGIQSSGKKGRVSTDKTEDA